MKKYILKSILILLAFSSFFSCSDVIDIKPEYILTSNVAFQKVEDFNGAINGMYANMRSVGYYGRNYSMLPDMATDNLTETTESLVNFKSVTDWVYKADNGIVAETWIGTYFIINSANIVINNIDRFTTDDNRKTANRIKGQALAARGLLHFDLLRYFANDFDRNSTALGVPIKTKAAIETPARATVKQTYDQIFADLQQARTLLSDVDVAVNAAGSRTRLDVTGVDAILARVSLYAKQYADAVKYSTEVITARPLASMAAFPDTWRDTNVDEVAWALFFGPGEGGRLAGDVYSPAGETRSEFDPSSEVISLYNRTNDVRFNAYFQAGTGNRSGRFVAKKYVFKGQAAEGIVNFKAFRTGEMYLIRAEAQALSNASAAALADLNTLRAARIANYTPGAETGQALLDAIATERRKELWLEGHRWFDLKRTTRVINRANCGTSTQCALAANRPEWTWPIPQGELLANPAIAGQQNAGY